MDFLLDVEPRELSFPLEVNKKLCSSITLLNRTDNDVAFKLFTTQPKKYGVQPRIGILSPGSSCVITVRMKALKRAPAAMLCKDKFLIQCRVASSSASTEDAKNLFNAEAAHLIQECILKVVFSLPPPQVPSVSTQSTIESSLPTTSQMDNQLTETPNEKRNTQNLLEVQPSELQFPLKFEKDFSRSFQLSNTTENHIAFMVTIDKPIYCFQPTYGIVLPQSTCDITVRLREQKEVSADLTSEDKIVIQSSLSSLPLTAADSVIQDVLGRLGSNVEEYGVRVVYMLEEKKSIQTGELIRMSLIIILAVFILWYLVKHTLSLIWSVIVVILMLVAKMAKKLVSESVEDWVVKTLVYILMHLLLKCKETFRLSCESFW